MVMWSFGLMCVLVLLLKILLTWETADKFRWQIILQHVELVFLCRLGHTGWLPGSGEIHFTPAIIFGGCLETTIGFSNRLRFPVQRKRHLHQRPPGLLQGIVPCRRIWSYTSRHWFCSSVTALESTMPFHFGVKGDLTCILLFTL